MEAVLVPWFATTARPSFWLIARPSGVVPTETGLPSNWPNVGLAGFRPQRRTCKPETKPAPKIFTPDKLHVPAGEPGGGTQVSVACGTKALGTPPMTPTPGVGLGTTTPEICVGFRGVVVPGPPKSMMSIVPLPDISTKA